MALLTELVLLFDLFSLKTPNVLLLVMFLYHESFSHPFSGRSASHIYFFPLRRLCREEQPLFKAGAACLWFSFVAELIQAVFVPEEGLTEGWELTIRNKEHYFTLT